MGPWLSWDVGSHGPRDERLEEGQGFPHGAGSGCFLGGASRRLRLGLAGVMPDSTWTCARGLDMMNTAAHYLDLIPKGRDEKGHSPQFWVRRHDEYGE